MLPFVDGDTLLLAGVALSGATRDALQGSLERAGAHAQPDASPHVAHFDLGTLDPPVLKTLVILFDKEDRFVGAKFSGMFKGDEARLLELLRNKCGAPQKRGNARKQQWIWRFGGHIDMTLESGDDVPDTTLQVRDQVAARAAKARRAPPVRSGGF